jgi:hypothetical protein
MNVDDLLDPLRYENLRDYTLANLEAIGGGVFTERDTLEHLRMLDLIAKAYQSVHVPTLGMPIPQSTFTTTATLSTTEQTLLTAENNEVLEILSISCPSGTSSGMSAGMLQVYSSQSLTTVPYAHIPLIDDLTVSFSGLIYGHVVEVTNFKQIMQPVPLLLNGGDSLSIKVKSAPDPTVTFTILYRKRLQ